jgi:hypothetical protein
MGAENFEAFGSSFVRKLVTEIAGAPKRPMRCLDDRARRHYWSRRSRQVPQPARIVLIVWM